MLKVSGVKKNTEEKSRRTDDSKQEFSVKNEKGGERKYTLSSIRIIYDDKKRSKEYFNVISKFIPEHIDNRGLGDEHTYVRFYLNTHVHIGNQISSLPKRHFNDFKSIYEIFIVNPSMHNQCIIAQPQNKSTWEHYFKTEKKTTLSKYEGNITQTKNKNHRGARFGSNSASLFKMGKGNEIKTKLRQFVKYKTIHSLVADGNIHELINLNVNHENVNGGDFHGLTALHIAAAKNNSDIAKMLVEKGAQCVEDKWGSTQMHTAVCFGALDVLIFLREKFPDTFEKYIRGGDIPLPLLAATYGHINIIEYLLESCGVNVGNPPLK